MVKPIDDVIAAAWNIQAGRKVYPLCFGTSDVDGILQAIDEGGYVIHLKWRNRIRLAFARFWAWLGSY